MKFTKVRFIGLSAIDLPIVDALPSDHYILKDIEGLGPPEVDVSISKTLYAGGVYQGRRPQNREVVAKVGLNPDHAVGQTASDLRSSLYGMLTPGSTDNVQLDLLDGANVVASTIGYVSNLEIVPFSNEPQVQVVMPCLQPYLHAPNILFVDPGSQLAPTIENSGTAPTGFYMEIIFTGNLSSWALLDVNGKKMEFNYDFIANDKLAFDTRAGSRGIWLTRDSVTSNIIYSLSTDSVWHQFYGGDNIFSTSSQAFNWGDVYYLPQYWGI